MGLCLAHLKTNVKKIFSTVCTFKMGIWMLDQKKEMLIYYNFMLKLCKNPIFLFCLTVKFSPALLSLANQQFYAGG
jgi:hypothetical protein